MQTRIASSCGYKYSMPSIAPRYVPVRRTPVHEVNRERYTQGRLDDWIYCEEWLVLEG